MSVKIRSFKGHATISLDAESRFPFTFGVAKAQLILANLDAIKAFVAGQTSGTRAPDVDRLYEDQCARACGLDGVNGSR